MLKCRICHRMIEELSEQEALDDLEPHGWNNPKTAQDIKCFDCMTEQDDYETYYAGRISKKYPKRVYRMMPDVTNPDPDAKEVNTYHER